MAHPLSEAARRWWLVALAVLLSGWILWPWPAFGLEAATGGFDLQRERGATLFGQHCAGCHWRGGNVIRRGKTLKLTALRRAGLDGPEALARVAAEGLGQMGGYAAVLGPGGAEAVGAWAWEQALADWPTSKPKETSTKQ